MVGVSKVEVIEHHINYLNYGLPRMAAAYVLLSVRRPSQNWCWSLQRSHALWSPAHATLHGCCPAQPAGPCMQAQQSVSAPAMPRRSERRTGWWAKTGA